MPTFNKIKAILRFIRQEGAIPTIRRTIAGVTGLLYHVETAYLLERSVAGTPGEQACLDGITIELLDEGQIDRLSAIAYCGRREILRRLNEGQKCIIAKHREDIVHYSWLTTKSEYAGEIEMMIPVETGETYLYNCRTLTSARGQGIFPVVIARALAAAEQSGASRMIALVSRDNTPSLKAFEKARFRIRQETALTRLLVFRKHGTKRHG